MAGNNSMEGRKMLQSLFFKCVVTCAERLTLSVAVVVVTFCGHVLAQEETQEQHVAIIVHNETPLDNLSEKELRRIFMAEQQFWPDKSRITLLVQAPVSSLRDLVLDVIYSMTEQEFRQYWVSKMFRAEIASGPKLVYTSDMAQTLVEVIPGAITFVPFSELQDGVKVITVNGKLPGDDGYLLSNE